MLDGFWTVSFSATTDMGAGVIAIQGGKATGGDSSFTYIGTITEDESGNFAGELKVDRHNNLLPAVIPGLDNYALAISGRVSGASFEATGRVKGNESIQMTIKGKKVA